MLRDVQQVLFHTKCRILETDSSQVDAQKAGISGQHEPMDRARGHHSAKGLLPNVSRLDDRP